MTTVLDTPTPDKEDLGGLDLELLTACIDACVACAVTSAACADACLSEDRLTELTSSIRADLDCAEICATTSGALAQYSADLTDFVRVLLAACLTACRACANECTRHQDVHEHCRACAVAARRCESACAVLLAVL